MKYLNKYNSIMERYRSGEFGDKTLSMHDILESADEPDLLYKMDLSEVQYLLDSSYGVIKKLFSMVKQKTTESIVAMEKLEEELKTIKIDLYRESARTTDEELARNLNLLVEYCDPDGLPCDTEAMLCPIDNDGYLGVIKIQRDCVRSHFSFRHELIHYFRDVKVGNRVKCQFARKTKGKTPNDEEQDVNYLTAASIMPIEEIRKVLDEFETTVTKQDEAEFLTELSELYEQDEDAVLRRLIEVRSLVDYATFSKT